MVDSRPPRIFSFNIAYARLISKFYSIDLLTVKEKKRTMRINAVIFNKVHTLIFVECKIISRLPYFCVLNVN